MSSSVRGLALYLEEPQFRIRIVVQVVNDLNLGSWAIGMVVTVVNDLNLKDNSTRKPVLVVNM